MNANMTILDPVAPAGSAGSGHAFRPLGEIKGKVIGFIDNSKPNFSLLADDLAELLTTRYGAAGVVRHRKLTASISASEEVIADIKRQCDLVITGSGD